MNVLIKILISLQLTFFNTPPTKSELYDELIKQEILFPDIVLRQAIIETNCGKTGVGKTKNNLFGFAYKDKKTKKLIYHTDSTWIHSVKRYKTWQDKYYPIHLDKAHQHSNCDYYHFLEAMGWKKGVPHASTERSYTNALRKLVLNF